MGGPAPLQSKHIALQLVLKLSPVIHVIEVTGRTVSLLPWSKRKRKEEATFVLTRPC